MQLYEVIIKNKIKQTNETKQNNNHVYVLLLLQYCEI